MKRVLIVDDELLVRMGFRSILDWESCGFTVVGEAADGEEALQKIGILKPDLVFTDLKMDRMDGFDLMRACAKEYPYVKFIVLSSYNDFENVRQAMRCGALDYVFKLDVKPDQMRRILSEIQWEESAAQTVSQSELRAMRASAARRAIVGEIAEKEIRKSFSSLYPALCWDAPFRLITVAIDNYELREGNAHQRLSQSVILEIENILEEVFADLAIICPLQAAYARAEEYVRRYLSNSITAVMSNEHDSLAALPQAHLENEETLSFRFDAY